MKQSLLCITCPLGCRLEAERLENGDIAVFGNRCARGEAFAKTELTNPVRSLTTTVKTSFPGVPVVPVRTAGEIPKDKLKDAMQQLNALTLTEPLGCGDTLLESLSGCDCRVIVTSDILKTLD